MQTIRQYRPTLWSESYSVLGQNLGSTTIFADDNPIRSQQRFNYLVKCKLCSAEHEYNSKSVAVIYHFVHCSKEHGYVFPEDSHDLLIISNNELLQSIIIDSQLYGLSMPGYNDHEGCIKQFRQGKPVCILHKDEGNWAIRGKLYW